MLYYNYSVTIIKRCTTIIPTVDKLRAHDTHCAQESSIMSHCECSPPINYGKKRTPPRLKWCLSGEKLPGNLTTALKGSSFLVAFSSFFLTSTFLCKLKRQGLS